VVPLADAGDVIARDAPWGATTRANLPYQRCKIRSIGVRCRLDRRIPPIGEEEGSEPSSRDCPFRLLRRSRSGLREPESFAGGDRRFESLSYNGEPAERAGGRPASPVKLTKPSSQNGAWRRTKLTIANAKSSIRKRRFCSKLRIVSAISTWMELMNTP
jgi:hypothetical protein